jgi:hypothetical protein
MRVSPLSAWDVEYPRSDGEAEQIYQPRCFLAIALWSEEEAVLQEIVGVERRLPPLARLLQKKTGSR